MAEDKKENKTIKKGDFVQVEYTGRLKEEDMVFDTTSKEEAKKAGMDSQQQNFGPVTVCIGEGQLIPGLEKELEGKETGNEYKIKLKPEQAFGKKNAQLIKTIPSSAFKKQNIVPQPGMQVNIDGSIGIIKRAGGGRCLVDFNHPLSGKDVVYDVKLNNIITDDKEKIKSYISLALNRKDISVDVKDKKAEIRTEKELPKQVTEKLSEKLKEIVPSIKKIEFKTEKKKQKKKQDK
ncbi:peptidylprolyl isomerase [Candidatus Woesearchaeota archaeon]|nr:peptidylprolyl isomerase [Candidatus Woesearchaeota archaeon]